MEISKIEENCGPKPDDFTPSNQLGDNYIFENDPGFNKTNLSDFFGRKVTVNSYEECAHYVSGGWEANKTTIFEIAIPIVLIILFLFGVKKFKLINKFKVLKPKIDNKVKVFFEKMSLIKNFQKNVIVLCALFFQHFFIFNYVKSKASSIPTFIDEYVVLASSVNFFKNLDFNAEILGGSYSVYLTSGPISAIGSVISWNLSSNFIISRISNFYWIFILQTILSYLVVRFYKLNFYPILFFNGLILLLIPWWIGALYSIGEIASMVIFTNAMFLYSKNKKLSMILFSISIVYGKILTILPLIGFYIPIIIKKRSINQFLNDMLYFSVPLAIWLTLVHFKYASGNLFDYLIDQYNLIMNHSSSGVNTINDKKFFDSIENIMSTEVAIWSSYDLFRVAAVPIIFSFVMLKIRKVLELKFINIIYPITLSILIPYLWFWFFNANKWIRYSQHFTVIVLISLSYFIFTKAKFENFDYLLMVGLLIVFIDNSKILIILSILVSAIALALLKPTRSMIAVQIIIILFVTIDITNAYFQNQQINKTNISVNECSESITANECQQAYFRMLD